MNKIKLGILSGGNSIEREVSVKSCENLLNSLNKEKYDITLYNVDINKKDWILSLISNPPDVILNSLHGGRGENGSMQGFLHYLNIPYIGSKVLSSSICMDKKIAKTIMEANHIPTAQDIYVKRNENINVYKENLKRLGYPLIIKPNRGGSSIGIKICKSYEDILNGAKDIINKYDDDILIEKYIKGREIACCVLENHNSKEVCILDISSEDNIFSYEDKYEKSNSANISNMPEFMQDMIKAMAVKTFDCLKCRGYALVDMIVKEEQIYVLEVNTLPGLTKTSLIPKAANIIGISFGEYLDRLIGFELKI